MKRTHIITLLVLALLGGAFVYEVVLPSLFETEVAQATISIPIEQEGTVLEAMQSYEARSSFTFSGTEHPALGFFVESINGKKNEDGYYWFLYINGTSSPLGASQALVHTGDVVEWRYKTSE